MISSAASNVYTRQAQDNANDIEPEPPSSTLSSEFPPDSPDQNNNSSDSYRPNHRQPRPNFSMPSAVTTNDSLPVGNHVRANRVLDQHIPSQSPALNPRPRPQYHQPSSSISGYAYEHQDSPQNNSRESPSPMTHSPAFHPAQILLTPKIDQPEPSRKRKQGLKSQDYSTPSKRAKYSEPHTPHTPRSVPDRRALSEEIFNPPSDDCEASPLATATTSEYIGPSTPVRVTPPLPQAPLATRILLFDHVENSAAQASSPKKRRTSSPERSSPKTHTPSPSDLEGPHSSHSQEPPADPSETDSLINKSPLTPRNDPPDKQ